jgi:alpha-L-fucosidase
MTTQEINEGSKNPLPAEDFLRTRHNDAFPLNPKSVERTSDWFRGAGLGLFIHWDHTSQQGIEISWPMVGGVFALPGGKDVTVSQYHSTASTFNPEKWNPTEIMRQAKEAGCQYVVFTAKHHNGWASWPSKYGTRNITSSPFGKNGGDILKSYVDAVRSSGMKVGVYYSLSDWGYPDYLEWKDEYRPYVFGVSSPRGTDEQWDRYRTYLKNQLTEILTEYGEIDLLWFDGAWERSNEDWNSKDIGDHIRSLSPKTLINDRLFTQGDYRTPEQSIPPLPLSEPWECCMTMNYSWAYVPSDTAFKTPHEILRTLIEVVSRGGNLLLNIGPREDGSLVPEESELLGELGKWMALHKQTVVGVTPGLEPWQFYGPSTRRGDLVYLHQLAIPTESIIVRGIKVKRVRSVVNLSTGQKLDFIRRTAINDVMQSDPDGEIIIDTSGGKVSGLIPVIAVDFGADPDDIELRNW